MKSFTISFQKDWTTIHETTPNNTKANSYFVLFRVISRIA